MGKVEYNTDFTPHQKRMVQFVSLAAGILAFLWVNYYEGLHFVTAAIVFILTSFVVGITAIIVYAAKWVREDELRLRKRQRLRKEIKELQREGREVIKAVTKGKLKPTIAASELQRIDGKIDALKTDFEQLIKEPKK